MTSILARIRANGSEVVRDGWTVRLKRRGKLTDEAIAWIREHRDALIREVWPEYDDWQERAAIREFDGGQDRAEAEAEAYREVMARC